MTQDFKQSISNICAVRFDEPMSLHTTFKVGGPCECFAEPSSVDELSKVVSLCKTSDERFVVIGKGSNVIFRDEGFLGVVIAIGERMGRISVGSDEITAEAGASVATVSAVAMRNCISGFEPLSGIPGHIGGAVRMNAGAYGTEIKDLLKKVWYLEDGTIKTAETDELDLSYRHSVFCNSPDKIIVKASFDATNTKTKEEILANMAELAEKRKEKQPIEYPSAGSTFKRPEGYFAAKLIEDCGLKGFRIGGAEVSTKHAGFVINSGNAKAQDVIDIIKHIQNVVKEKTGVNLMPEVEII